MKEMIVPKDLDDLTITPDSGVDHRDTNKVSGVAKITKAFQATNATEQYQTGKSNFGMLGGNNRKTRTAN